MSIYSRTSRPAIRDRFPTPEQADALGEWLRKPMSARTECITSAVAGSVMFLLFFAVYMLTH